MKEVQKERYNRHLILNEIGEEGQQRLLNAKVLVVGAGGLGAPVLQYLCAAGVGTIGIMDADSVSLSNLQRQLLYTENEIGESKVEKSKTRLNQINSDVHIKSYSFHLKESNADEIIGKYDIVVGATDNFQSRKCIDKVTQKQGKAFVHASIGEFEGQVSVFNFKNGPSYLNLFPDVPDQADLPMGVLGVLPGIIGSLQACEVLKIILNIGDVLSGKLLIYDALKNKMNIVEFK
jgi:adenylyltransferase/sulfurtransferase